MNIVIYLSLEVKKLIKFLFVSVVELFVFYLSLKTLFVKKKTLNGFCVCLGLVVVVVVVIFLETILTIDKMIQESIHPWRTVENK